MDRAVRGRGRRSRLVRAARRRVRQRPDGPAAAAPGRRRRLVVAASGHRTAAARRWPRRRPRRAIAAAAGTRIGGWSRCAGRASPSSPSRTRRTRRRLRRVGAAAAGAVRPRGAAALDRARAVAIVGTRRPTDGRPRDRRADRGRRGRRSARRSCRALRSGIDAAAHAAAVRAGAPTVAVIGGGHERLYPAAHRGLAGAIVDGGGAVVSEFSPDTFRRAGHFPRRNRIISGLADATVVVEAGARSGALTTAAWALEQGRGLFIVPGRLDDPAVAGCLAFLREGGPRPGSWPGSRSCSRTSGSRAVRSAPVAGRGDRRCLARGRAGRARARARAGDRARDRRRRGPWTSSSPRPDAAGARRCSGR